MTGSPIPAEIEVAAERGGFSSAEYNALAMNARLDTIKLISLVLETNSDTTQDEDERHLAFGRKLVSCRFDEANHAAAAIFQFEVGVRSGSTEEFKCVADYAVLYEVPNGSSSETAMAFCKHVGSFAAYPYFRAVAAQMAWNAGVNLPPLPSIAAMPVVPTVPKKLSSAKSKKVVSRKKN